MTARPKWDPMNVAPSYADLVHRCADLEGVVGEAVVMLSRVSRQALNRRDRGVNVLVTRDDLVKLEAAVNAVRGDGYVDELRAKYGRGARGGRR